MGSRTHSFDANCALCDGATTGIPITVSGYTTYMGQMGVFDCGGNQYAAPFLLPSIADQSSLKLQQPRLEAALVIDVIGGLFTGTALFKIYVVGSNDPGFGSGNVCLNAMSFGNSAGEEFPNALTTPAPANIGGSRYELGFCNEQNGVKYQYVALFCVPTNSASLTFSAFIAALPRI